MAYRLRPDRSNLLRAGCYKINMGDVQMIYHLYTFDQWTLWQIKENRFEDATIRQIAVAVVHGKWDLEKKLFIQRPTFTYYPSEIDLFQFNVGYPTL